LSRGIFETKATSRQELLLDEFVNLAINRFTWEDLPYGLTSEQLEWMLIRFGTLACFKSKNQGVLILPCFGESKVNVYGLPTKYRVESLNGQYTDSIDIDNIALLKNNPTGTGDIETLEIFAKRIDDIEQTQDVNLFQQNMPKIILSDENGKLTAKNLIQKLKEYKFVIFGKKSLASNIEKSDVLDTSSPYLLDKLQDYKGDLRNELLTFLGINNNNVDKKERLITDEVNANNELISIMLDLMFDIREKFCEEVKEKFSLDIKVRKREVEEIGENDLPTRGVNRE